MTNSAVVSWTLALIKGSIVGALAILGLFIAIAVLVGVKKLRRVGRAGARTLDELVGDDQFTRFLPADTPRGPIDQLRAGTSGGRLP